MMRCSRLVAGAIGLLLGATPAAAQDLDPRAYAKVPVGFTVAIARVPNLRRPNDWLAHVRRAWGALRVV
jgi:hypothetical protein